MPLTHLRFSAVPLSFQKNLLISYALDLITSWLQKKSILFKFRVPINEESFVKKFMLLTCLFLLSGKSLFGHLPVLYTNQSIYALSPEGNFAFSSILLSPLEEEFIKKVQCSISDAWHEISNLPPDILKIPGMSSSKNRHFLNNLCSSPNTHYLEIGCWMGSTFISALFKNNSTLSSATAIDNWTEFGGPYLQFQSNCKQFISDIPYNFHSHDCFSIDPEKFIRNKINVYFYDGGHTRQDQANAFLFYNNIFEDVFIAIVDDWNHPPVREGTFDAFSKLGYKVLFEIGLPARANGDTEWWWNGLYIAVIRK